MAQFARPASDITTPTGWVGWPVDTAGSKYTNIDESTQDDDDSYRTTNGVLDSLNAEFTLSALTDPGVSTGHVLRYTYAKCFNLSLNNTGNSVATTVSLYQGATLIASATHTNITGASMQNGVLTLSGAEADAITDYSDLRVRLQATSSTGGSQANRRGCIWTWVEFEAPDAVGGAATNSFGIIIG